MPTPLAQRSLFSLFSLSLFDLSAPAPSFAHSLSIPLKPSLLSPSFHNGTHIRIYLKKTKHILNKDASVGCFDRSSCSIWQSSLVILTMFLSCVATCISIKWACSFYDWPQNTFIKNRMPIYALTSGMSTMYRPIEPLFTWMDQGFHGDGTVLIHGGDCHSRFIGTPIDLYPHSYIFCTFCSDL